MNMAMELTNSIVRAASPSSQGSHGFFSPASSTGLKLLNTTSIADVPNAPEVASSGNTISLKTGNTDRVKASESGNVFLGGQEDTSPTGSQTPGVTWNLSTTTLSAQGADNQIPFAIGRKGTTGTLMLIRHAGADVGSISYNGTATAYNTSSDYRIKSIQAVPTGFDPAAIVKQLADAQNWFTFNSDPSGTPQLGWLAHKLQAIEPLAVTGERDATENIGTLTYADGTQERDVPEMDNLPNGATWVKTGERMILQGRDDSKLIPVMLAALAGALERIEILERS